MKFSTKVIRNALANYAGSFVTLAVGLVLTPFLVNRLGDVEFGIWSLALSLFGWLSFFDLGLASAITKHIATYDATGEQQWINEAASTLFFVFLAFGALVVVLTLVALPVLPKLFQMPEGAVSVASMVFVLAALDFGVRFPSAVLSAALSGYQRIDLLNLIGVLATLTNMGLVIWALSRGGSVIAVAAVAVGVSLLTALARFYVLRRHRPGLSITLFAVRPRLLVGLATFGIAVFLTHAGAILQFELNGVLVGMVKGVSQVTSFEVARKVARFVLYVSTPLAGVLFPAFSELGARRDRDQARALLIQGTRWAVTMGLPLVLFLTIMAEPIVSLWISPRYSSSAPIAVALSIAFFATLSYSPSSSLLLGMGGEKQMALVSLLGGVANLTLSVLLMRSMGLLGVGLGTLIPTLLINFVPVISMAVARAGLHGRTFLRQVLAPIVVPSIVCAGTVLLFRTLFYPLKLGTLVLQAVVCMGIYFGVLALTMGTLERQAHKSEIRSLLGVRQ